MAHDVFLSYSRTDLGLCNDLIKLVKRLGYVPYRDIDDLTAGLSWRDQLNEAIDQPNLKPHVVVLCTRSAVAKPGQIVEEILEARKHELMIIPIEFDPGASKAMLLAAGYERPGSIHYIDALHPSGAYIVDIRLEDALRRALTHQVRKRLEERRVLAKDWADRLKPTISFWETNWRHYFPLDGGSRGLSGSVALTARGGSGKSYLIAHCVRHLVDDPSIYPVLVDEALLRNAAQELPRLLGARSVQELPRQVEGLVVEPPGEHRVWKPMRVVFVVDGLDQMVSPGDVQQKQLVDGLNLIVNSAPVLIGCRQEVWDAWYAGRVSVREMPVPELEEPQVRLLLQQRTSISPDWFNPLLKVPFFLDIALRRAGVWESLPRKETEFLHNVWTDAVDEGELLPGTTGRQWLLENLAACQLEQLTYNVHIAELRRRPGFLQTYETGLRELKKNGLLVEQPLHTPAMESTVRLRHDLLDNYSMMRIMMKEPGKLDRCRELCHRCGKDCGWSLLTTLVQAAHDWGDEPLKRELFAEFLFLLDNKNFTIFDPEANNRAWAVTHVLKACFIPLFPLIIEALSGEKVPSLDETNRDQLRKRISTLGPPARLTQEAASTLASAFMVLSLGSVQDAAVAVPVLTRGLTVWKLKGRFLDALAKYRTATAQEAIVTFGRRQLDERDDPESLLYVARNLRHFADPSSYGLLRELCTAEELDSMVRRVAAESLDHLLPGQVVVPLRDENEIVRGLRVHQSDGERYSDWHLVQDCADYVYRQLARGHLFSFQVLDALTKALDHDQVFVRRSVALALGLLDEPEARDALLNEVIEPGLPTEVRLACVEALERQLCRQTDLRSRQAHRYLLLSVARIARQRGDDLTEQRLVELALNPKLRAPGDWLLNTQVAEVVPPANGPWLERCSVTAQELEPSILRDLFEAGMEDVGPNRELKYRIVDLKSLERVIEVSLAPTTWHLGKNFHIAVGKQLDRFLRDGRSFRMPLPFGDLRLPGLAVVHVVVLTVDNRLLLSKRSALLSYAPLHWSASFEEQITERDVRGNDRVFHLAASRGMVEEFGIDVDPSRVHLLSVILELDNLNLGAVVLIDARDTLEQIRRSWSGTPRPSHAWEAEALEGIEVNLAALDALASGAECLVEPLHPTSQVRFALLARWLRWRAIN